MDETADIAVFGQHVACDNKANTAHSLTIVTRPRVGD
jgi:hypothetical protein